MRWFAVTVDRAWGRAELVEARRAPAEAPVGGEAGKNQFVVDAAGAEAAHTSLEDLAEAVDLGYGRLQLAFAGRQVRRGGRGPSSVPK